MTLLQAQKLGFVEDFSPESAAVLENVANAKGRADFEALASQIVDHPNARLFIFGLCDQFARERRNLPAADAQALAPTMNALFAKLTLHQQTEVAHTPEHFEQLKQRVETLPASRKHAAAMGLCQAADHSRIFMSDPEWEQSVATARSALSNVSMADKIKVAFTAEQFKELAKEIAMLPRAQSDVEAAALASRLETNIPNMGFQDGYDTLKVMRDMAGDLSLHSGDANSATNFAASVLNASSRIIQEANGPSTPLTYDNRANITKVAETLQDTVAEALHTRSAGQTQAQFEKLLQSTLGRPEQKDTSFTRDANHKEGRRGSTVSAPFGLRVLPTLVDQLPRTPEGDRQAIAMLTAIVERTVRQESVGYRALCEIRTPASERPLQAVEEVIKKRGLQDSTLNTILAERQEVSDVLHATRGTPAEVAKKMGEFAAQDGLKMKAIPYTFPVTLESETLRSFGDMVNVVNTNNPKATEAAAEALFEAYKSFVTHPSKLEVLHKQLTGSTP